MASGGLASATPPFIPRNDLRIPARTSWVFTLDRYEVDAPIRSPSSGGASTAPSPRLARCTRARIAVIEVWLSTKRR